MQSLIQQTRIPTNHISYEAQYRVREMIKPLKQLGVSYFDIGVVYSDGSGYTLHTNSDFYETWFSEEFPLSAFNLKSNWYTWDSICDERMLNIGRSLDIDNGILHVENNLDKTVLVAFGSQSGDKRAFNAFLNNLHVLKRFKKYFIENANDLLIKANHQRISYAPNLHKENPLLEYILKDITFDGQTPINQFCQAFSKLSPRELQCFSLWVRGHTTHEICAKLSLRPTSVSVYKERIRQKLGCTSKKELLAKTQELGLIEFYQI